MIDAHAVLGHLAALRNTDFNGSQGESLEEWLKRNLQPVPVQHDFDAAGNHWITLAGQTDKAIVLGCYFEASLEPNDLASRLGLVAAMETLKALAHRPENLPACTLKLVVWATRDPLAAGAIADKLDASFKDAMAYLEVQSASRAGLLIDDVTFGVLSSEALEKIGFHSRLVALFDEAVRELTGRPGFEVQGNAPNALAIAQRNVPAAVMYVHNPIEGRSEELSDATRLQVLQAAEVFCRWVESTMQLVSGEEVDLWAIERRLPNS